MTFVFVIQPRFKFIVTVTRIKDDLECEVSSECILSLPDSVHFLILMFSLPTTFPSRVWCTGWKRTSCRHQRSTEHEFCETSSSPNFLTWHFHFLDTPPAPKLEFQMMLAIFFWPRFFGWIWRRLPQTGVPVPGDQVRIDRGINQGFYYYSKPSSEQQNKKS